MSRLRWLTRTVKRGNNNITETVLQQGDYQEWFVYGVAQQPRIHWADIPHEKEETQDVNRT